MPFSHDDYTVAWFTPRCHNVYTLGNIGSHNVVMVCLPSGVYGTISAATVVSHLKSTFLSLRFGLMVGIGGGVPSGSADIRLGDIVVSKPAGTSGGVIQYDYGKTLRDGRFQHTGMLNKPPLVLLKAVAHLESDHMAGKSQLIRILANIQVPTTTALDQQFLRPTNDWLFRSEYSHDESKFNCCTCDQNQLVIRLERTAEEPYTHYGLIASGDQVMKDARTRDSIAQGFNVLCFEMEAAGLMDELPSIVIRGICDYCDSHKNE
ncbi:hypothetical protein FE257_005340 [Aspergillus nanangensis]|uniref:Nucleoside phosphorylase domain-containing protein n=1 Tax=Aspergillus nanangensis TaxID=2582783 RepID=A0AAD4CAA4_ASPNN|nr:hypothetical protein FE257_005340 [Aspergillus nanangensis]